jgi:hypothetical protein
MLYGLLADAVLVLHFGIVLFIVGGLVAIVLGNWRGWRWVNRLWFRIAHLAAIAVVVLQAWLGAMCPLTTLESWLRVRSGSSPYTRSFIETWLHELIFYDAPTWVFTLVYTIFGLVVLGSWRWFPPNRRAANG